ncbi:hypothetical protein ES703_53218 [subsurface metagenome]
MKFTLQGVAVSLCILVAIFGAIFAGIGAFREAAAASPGEGVVMIVAGSIALGFASLGISFAAKMFHNK